MRTERFHRVVAITPGKHGEKDWRVTFNGYAPTLAEAVALLGFLLLSEERYDKPKQLGRYMYWQFIDDLLHASKTPEMILALAEDCQAAVKDSSQGTVAA